MTPILRFYTLIKFPNQGSLLGQSVAVNTLPSLEYILSTNPSDPASYNLDQVMGSFLVEFHYRWSSYIHFLNENLGVIQSKLVHTSSARR